MADKRNPGKFGSRGDTEEQSGEDGEASTGSFNVRAIAPTQHHPRGRAQKLSRANG